MVGAHKHILGVLESCSGRWHHLSQGTIVLGIEEYPSSLWVLPECIEHSLWKTFPLQSKHEHVLWTSETVSEGWSDCGCCDLASSEEHSPLCWYSWVSCETNQANPIIQLISHSFAQGKIKESSIQFLSEFSGVLLRSVTFLFCWAYSLRECELFWQITSKFWGS